MFDFIIYANDTTLSTTEMVRRNTTDRTTSDVLNKELSLVNDWLRVNILSSIVKKGIYMIFYTQKKNV